MSVTTVPSSPSNPCALAPQAQLTGIGWRHPHYRALLEQRPRLGFIEVHSENFFADGGAALAVLQQAREHYELSLHGVGLSLGSAGALDDWHLQRLDCLVRRMQPWLVSEHAAYARGVPLAQGGSATATAFAASGGWVHANDLLPLPFSPAALQALVDHVDQVQTLLGRRIAVENVSAYLLPPGGEALSEPEVEAGFLRELAERSGCLLLVDVNNLVVNALNAQRRGVALDLQSHCERWLDRIDPASVAEIHLAGHDTSGSIVIDHHGCAVPDSVWPVYAAALRRFGQVPTLVEWDNHLPSFEVLLDQARAADVRVADALQASPAMPAMTTTPAALQHGRVQAVGLGHSASPVVPTEARLALAQQQGELLAWLQSDESLPRPAPAGLAVYRNNARGLALRCLGAAFPVLRELVGATGFEALANDYRRADPPRRGDLADWGGGLADWLAQSTGLLADAPYLPDMARLEWAMHRAELAPDAPLPAWAHSMSPIAAADEPAHGPGGATDSGAIGPHGLQLLADCDPADLLLSLAPASQILISRYPVVAIWQAHRDAAQGSAPQEDDAAAASRGLLPGALEGALDGTQGGEVATSSATGSADPADRLTLSRRSTRLARIAAEWSADPQPCLALLWRPQWRVRLVGIDAGQAAFVQAVLAGKRLSIALDAGLAAHPPLDFGRWLVQALGDGLLRGVQRAAGRTGSSPGRP